MARQHALHHVSPAYLPEIKTVGIDRPSAWLRAGWNDLMQNPVASIGYGLVLAIAYGAIIWFTADRTLYHVGLQLIAGFTLVAPLLAVGFYNLSRRIELGRPPTFASAVRAWGANTKGFLAMGTVLVLVLLAWFMVSIQLTAFLNTSKTDLVLGMGAQSLSEFGRALVTQQMIPLLLGFFLTGLVAALVVFAFTAVAIPMLLDRPEVDAITALVTSWKAVTHNWKTMLAWAVLIVAVTFIGLLFLYVGVAVAVPLLGHATWHAYRDLLGEWREVELPKVGYY